MGQYRNPNYPALVKAVDELGGSVTGIRAGGKHFIVMVKTPKGSDMRVTLSKAPMRDGHVKFWVRTHMRRHDSGNPAGYRGADIKRGKLK